MINANGACGLGQMLTRQRASTTSVMAACAAMTKFD
jgi:hypothetical protein